MPAEPRDDDSMYGQATLAARDRLADTLIAATPVATVRVDCDNAPLRIAGTLDDERPYHFRARFGTARLSIAPVGKDPTGSDARTESTACRDGVVTENHREVAVLFRTLLALHGL